MANNDSDSQQKSRKTPEWATKPFKEFLDYIENLDRVLMLSTSGISMIRAVPRAIEAIAKAEDEDRSSVEEKLKKAQANAEFAQKEVDTGFPLLYGQAVVSLWGGLESLIRVFLAEWLTNESKAMRVNAIQKIKIQLGDYESLSKEEKPYYVLDLLERDLQFPLKQGIGRFETMLDVFGIVGTVDEDIKKSFFEMNHVRNLLVHRRGIIDKRFVVACPWLGFNIGDVMKVSHQEYKRYSHSAISYITELIVRTAVYFGKSRDEFKEILNGSK